MTFSRSLLRLRAPALTRAVRPAALPALVARPTTAAARSFAVESPPPGKPSSADDTLEQTLPTKPPPEVQAAVADVEQSEGLQRLATDERAQDVFRRFGAYLESRGHNSENPPTVEQFGALVLDEAFRALLLEMKATVSKLGLTEEEVGNLGKKMKEIQRSTAGKPSSE